MRVGCGGAVKKRPTLRVLRRSLKYVCRQERRTRLKQTCHFLYSGLAVGQDLQVYNVKSSFKYLWGGINSNIIVMAVVLCQFVGLYISIISIFCSWLLATRSIVKSVCIVVEGLHFFKKWTSLVGRLIHIHTLILNFAYPSSKHFMIFLLKSKSTMTFSVLCC